MKCEICKTNTRYIWTVRTFRKTVLTYNVCRKCIPKVPNIDTGSIYSDVFDSSDGLWYCKDCNEVYNTRNGSIDEKHRENCHKKRMCASCGKRTIIFRILRDLRDYKYGNFCADCIVKNDPISQIVESYGGHRKYIRYCSDCKKIYKYGEEKTQQELCEHCVRYCAECKEELQRDKTATLHAVCKHIKADRVDS